ncbi:hypothetical protein [Thermococcus sp.]|uniref:hypothetical protein n=1 Tax=Thermococcus sp. TaxID=35749 RepID=UPI0026102F3B|nr:hypothetical protein [Thermococcus sp.]
MLRHGGVLPVIVGTVLAVILIAIIITGAVAAVVIVHDHQTHKIEAGPLKELGTFDASGIILREIVGDVRIVRVNVSGVVLKSNLPIKAYYSRGLLTVYCPREREKGLLGSSERNARNEYKGGKVVIEVGKRLSEMQVREIVGNINVNVNTTRTILMDVVGDISAVTPAEYVIDNIMGDIPLHARRDVNISDVVGDVEIFVPENLSIQLTVNDIMGKLENTHSGSGTPVLVRVSDVMGNVRIG